MYGAWGGYGGAQAAQQQLAGYQRQQAAAYGQAGAAALAQQVAQSAPAPQADAEVGDASVIQVQNCAHPVVGPIVNGTYNKGQENHGRPTYLRDQKAVTSPGTTSDVMAYFWDERDGAALCGWWLGAKVGGDQAWGYNPSKSMTPPTSGWRVPHNGPADPALSVVAAGPAGGGAAGSGDLVGGTRHIVVSGVSHDNVAKYLNGAYTVCGENHGKPAYKKDAQVSGLDTILYFWDARDGQSFSGWWFGPEVGGDKVMAHSSRDTQTPPMKGWSVPHNGPADPAVSVMPAGPPAGLGTAGMPQQQGSMLQQQQQMQMPQHERQALMMQQKRQEQEAKLMQQQAALKQRQEQMMEARRKAAEEAAKKLQDEKARSLDMQKRQQDMMVEKRKQQEASAKITAVVARVRQATPDNLEDMQKQLEEVQAELENCGPHREKLQAECDSALKQALEQVGGAKDKVKETENTLETIVKHVGFAEVRLQSFHKDVDGLPIAKSLKFEEDLQKYIQDARTKIGIIQKQIATLTEGVPERLQLFISNSAAEMSTKAETLLPRLKEAEEPAQKARDSVADQVAQLEDEVAGLIKYHQRIKRLDNDSLFVEVDTKKDNKVDRAEFCKFFSCCEKDPVVANAGSGDDASGKKRALTKWPGEEELEVVFKRIEQDAEGCISRATFLQFLAEYMKVVKATAITSEMGMKGHTLRRVLPGEAVEVLEGPVRDDLVQTLRIRARTLTDSVEGWVTIESNTGSAFLVEGGKVFKFKVGEKGTMFTDSFKYKIKVSNRKLKEGEILESRDCAQKDVLSGLTRMKVTLKSEGKQGWVTVVGNQNQVFIHPTV